MLGTIVNVCAILLGGLLGLCMKRGLKAKYSEIVIQVLALSVLFIGASSALKGLLSENVEPILFIVSLVVGSLFGTWIDLEEKLQRLGDFLQTKTGGQKGNIAQGFVTASLLFCVGTMAVLGSLESGISGNHTTLYVKSVLDGASAVVFASALGVGVLFSAAAVFVYQGTLTICAGFLAPHLTENTVREMGIVGGMLIFSLGLTMLELKRFKTANMLPALLVPVLYYLPQVQAAAAWIKTLFL